jgi:hypothetical protein
MKCKAIFSVRHFQRAKSIKCSRLDDCVSSPNIERSNIIHFVS